jgi:hypothetical protein
MSTHDPINIAFEKKIQSIDRTMEQLKSLIGSEPPKGTIPLAMMIIVDNIRSLYVIDQEICVVSDRFRNEIVNLLQESQPQNDLKSEVKDLEQRFKNTFSSLEDSIKSIVKMKIKKTMEIIHIMGEFYLKKQLIIEINEAIRVKELNVELMEHLPFTAVAT